MLHDPELAERFRVRLRELLDRQNLSQRQLAKRCGFKSDRFRYYLKSGAPKADKLGAIAYGFGLTVPELLHGVVDEKTAVELAKLNPVAPVAVRGRADPLVPRASVDQRRETRPAVTPKPEPVQAAAPAQAAPPSRQPRAASGVHGPSEFAIEGDSDDGAVRIRVNMMVSRATAAEIVSSLFSQQHERVIAAE